MPEISYKPNIAVDGAPNFRSRWLPNFRSCAYGICTTAAGHASGLIAQQREFSPKSVGNPLRARRDRMHFLHRSGAFVGFHHKGEFKNSQDRSSAATM
jgi:hypothetical protein